MFTKFILELEFMFTQLLLTFFYCLVLPKLNTVQKKKLTKGSL